MMGEVSFHVADVYPPGWVMSCELGCEAFLGQKHWIDHPKTWPTYIYIDIIYIKIYIYINIYIYTYIET
jgi:hypothetical protein